MPCSCSCSCSCEADATVGAHGSGTAAECTSGKGGEAVHPTAHDTALGSAVVGPRGTVDPYRHLVYKKMTGLRVEWTTMGATYTGFVVAVKGDEVSVYYPCDGKTIEHDFGSDGCIPRVIEPPLYMLSMLRSTASGGYEALLSPEDGRVWSLTHDDVKSHFLECGESHFLSTLGDTFTHVPEGRKAKKIITKPDCALGQLCTCRRRGRTSRRCTCIS